MRAALALADGCVAVAEATRDKVCRYARVRSSFIDIIPNGVESPSVGNRADTRRDIRRSLGIPERAFVVGTVARLAKVKNLGLLIRASGSWKHHDSPLHVLVVGDGPESSQLQELATELGLAGVVHFAGEQQDVGRWLAAMDVYVNCSLSEGTSLSLMEAMAASLPAVVTDVGDNAKLVDHGGGGVVIPSDDVSALAAALERLLDEPLRTRMARRARELFRSTYDCTATVRAYEQLYERILRRKDRR